MTSVKNGKRKKNPKRSQGVVGARRTRLTELDKVLMGKGMLVNAKPKDQGRG